MKQKLLWIVSGLMVLGLLAACSTSPTVQSAPVATTAAANVRTLSATGTGEVYITPDIAYINIGVHTEASDVTSALSQNSQQAQSISDTLTGLGVDVKDIQTSNFNVYPINNYGTDGQITNRSYGVDNTVYITVRDLSKLGDLLDAVVKSGANTINGITFDVQDRSAAEEQARDLAIQAAKDQAASIAKAAGVTLGDLQTISVNASGTSSVVYDKYNAAYGGGANVPVSAGQLLISIDANLTYALK
jgi:uncharacterized protein YggE